METGTPARKRQADGVDRTVGLRVRLIRREKGLTQAELGKSLGISYQQVQKYESGSSRMSVSLLVHIADALDVNIQDLLDEARPCPQNDGTAGMSVTEAELNALVDSFASLPTPELRSAVLHLIAQMKVAQAS